MIWEHSELSLSALLRNRREFAKADQGPLSDDSDRIKRLSIQGGPDLIRRLSRKSKRIKPAVRIPSRLPGRKQLDDRRGAIR